MNIAVYLQVQHFAVRVHHLATTDGDVLLTPANLLLDDGVLMVLLDNHSRVGSIKQSKKTSAPPTMEFQNNEQSDTDSRINDTIYM